MLYVIWNVVEEMDSNSVVMACNIYIYGSGGKNPEKMRSELKKQTGMQARELPSQHVAERRETTVSRAAVERCQMHVLFKSLRNDC